jgi:hypothetical protein
VLCWGVERAYVYLYYDFMFGWAVTSLLCFSRELYEYQGLLSVVFSCFVHSYRRWLCVVERYGFGCVGFEWAYGIYPL